MNKAFMVFIGLLVSSILLASSPAVKLQRVTIDLEDEAKLQRGAKMFMNYCSGCHSLRYLRYSQMARDLGLTTFDGEVDKDLLYNNLVFTQAKIHDPIQISMPAVDAREWFGIEPPDLTLSARVRGADWIYTYLQSFYEDPEKPFGTDNLLIPGVAMPNVLAPLAGRVIAVKKEGRDHKKHISHLLLVQQGKMTQQEFDSSLEDLVNFLVYAAEPAQLVRYKIGFWVLAFLLLLFLVVYPLKKIYWRRIK